MIPNEQEKSTKSRVNKESGEKTKSINLWLEVGNRCLERAVELLDSETATTEETVATVERLVNTAIQIDLLNLRWEMRNKPNGIPF